MSDSATTTARPSGWSVEGFRAFWANPDASLVPAALTEDVVGHWSGRDEPVCGKVDYTRCIEALIEALPDVQLEVPVHAQQGDLTFVNWIMRATRFGPIRIGSARWRTQPSSTRRACRS
jgi:hypothetical protein